MASVLTVKDPLIVADDVVLDRVALMLYGLVEEGFVMLVRVRLKLPVIVNPQLIWLLGNCMQLMRLPATYPFVEPAKGAKVNGDQLPKLKVIPVVDPEILVKTKV